MSRQNVSTMKAHNPLPFAAALLAAPSMAHAATEGGLTTGVILLVIGLLLYFLPGIVAGRRDHTNANAIFALNLLLGWTLLGWVIALVWSLTGTTRQKPTEARAPNPVIDQFLANDGSTKTCPYCAEKILAAAVKCKHCGSALQ